MALFKELKELQEKLKYYEDMVPVNNMVNGVVVLPLKVIKLK